MKNLYHDTRVLDKGAVERYSLTEEIMMENAAAALEKAVLKCGAHRVLVLTGGGNNGADGMALSRRLSGALRVAVYCVCEPKSELCIRQKKRAEYADVVFLDDTMFRIELLCTDCIVDCLYGSGFHGTLDVRASSVIKACNSTKAHRISCDVPSGLDAQGKLSSDGTAFNADVTVTMGAQKTALYSDTAKDCAGDIVCADLGVSKSMFESSSGVSPQAYLLEKSDMRLPLRNRFNVNKGTFGHAAVIAGEKCGAAIITGKASFALGAGLVTLVNSAPSFSVPAELMVSCKMPPKTTAAAIGMGLGNPCENKNAFTLLSLFEKWFCSTDNPACVIDADLFKYKGIASLLKSLEAIPDGRIVLTPHPKEFQSLLSLCALCDCSLKEIAQNRLEIASRFVDLYQGVVLILKGANTLIACRNKQKCSNGIYIDSFGMPCLAKGGSGDVLSGLVCALLAQGYSALDAAITGTLAHSFASRRIGTQFGMTPDMLIESVRFLQ